MAAEGQSQGMSGPERAVFSNYGANANSGNNTIGTQNNYFPPNGDSAKKDRSEYISADRSPIRTLPNLPAIVGRKEQLEQIATSFQTHDAVVLTGVTGIGKSHLASSFVESLSSRSTLDKLHNAHRFWVSCCCPEYFYKAYRDIAKDANIERQSTASVDLLNAVRKWLQSPESGSWLLILDDVNMSFLESGDSANTWTDVRIRDYIPQLSSGENGPVRVILATTRQLEVLSHISPGGAKEIKIKQLDMDDCQHLLSSSTTSSDTLEDVKAVARSLDQHPASIISAKWYIDLQKRHRNGFGMAAYQARIRQKGTWNTLQEHNIIYDGIPGHGKQLYKPWVMSLEAIWKDDPHAIRLFGLMCCFDRNCIPDVLLTGAWKREQNVRTEDIEDRLARLSEYGLIEFCDEEGPSRRISRLVVLATRHWLWTERSSDPACSEDHLHQQAITAITEYYRSLRKGALGKIFELRQITNQILPHLRLIKRYCRKESPLLERLKPEVVSGLVEIAGLYTEVGRYDSAGAVLVFAQKNCSLEDRWSAVAFRDLADTLCRPDTHPTQEHLRYSELLLEQAISITHELEDLDLEIRISFSLPPILLRQGKPDDALELHNELIEQIRVKYSQDDMLLFHAKRRRGILHYERGSQDLAKKDIEEALQHLNDNHSIEPNARKYFTVAAKASLARIFNQLGNFDRASELMKEVYHEREGLLGKNDVKTLNSGIDLAFYMLNHNAPDQSKTLLEEIQARISKVGRENSESMKRCQKALNQIAQNSLSSTKCKAMDTSETEDLQELRFFQDAT